MCFLIRQRLYCWLFHRHCSSEFFLFVFLTLHDYKLACDLPSHARFDDLDLVSRPQLCQNHIL